MNNKKIRQMVELQNKFNKLVHPEWHKQGYDWRRAIWLESAELIEHLPWKWWKAKEPDMQQVKLELVDIWHFITAWAIENETPALLENIASDHNYSPKLGETIITSTEEIAKHALLKDLPNTITAFKKTMDFIGMSFNDLYALYIGKNVLNKFRQDNGYKAGTYIKMWTDCEKDDVCKEEDNDAMMIILAELKNTDFTFEDLYGKLKERYLRCIEFNTTEQSYGL